MPPLYITQNAAVFGYEHGCWRHGKRKQIFEAWYLLEVRGNSSAVDTNETAGWGKGELVSITECRFLAWRSEACFALSGVVGALRVVANANLTCHEGHHQTKLVPLSLHGACRDDTQEEKGTSA